MARDTIPTGRLSTESPGESVPGLCHVYLCPIPPPYWFNKGANWHKRRETGWWEWFQKCLVPLGIEPTTFVWLAVQKKVMKPRQKQKHRVSGQNLKKMVSA